MNRQLIKIPANPCAFHQSSLITHFCKYWQCLLPLCRECVPIHRKEHNSKKQPIQLISIEEQTHSIFNSIGQGAVRLQLAYKEIIGRVNHSNNLHARLKRDILADRDGLVHNIHVYYQSLNHQIDQNYHRRQRWLQELTQLYQTVKQQLATIQSRLQGDKHLRTIIMWNRLQPFQHINDIIKQSQRQYQPPSSTTCDVQTIIEVLSQSQKMVVLDLQGDMGFAQLEKVLYTLRYGEEESILNTTNKQLGISLTRQSKLQKLHQTKSADRF